MNRQNDGGEDRTALPDVINNPTFFRKIFNKNKPKSEQEGKLYSFEWISEKAVFIHLYSLAFWTRGSVDPGKLLWFY